MLKTTLPIASDFLAPFICRDWGSSRRCEGKSQEAREETAAPAADTYRTRMLNPAF